MGETSTTTTTEKQTSTTTTTEKPVDTTTTTKPVEVDPKPTGDEASVNHPGGEASPAAKRQGETAIDEKAKTDVLGGGPADPDKDAAVQAENIENAKQDGLRNADRERQAQPRETGQPERDEDR
jgi:hypothetical protein